MAQISQLDRASCTTSTLTRKRRSSTAIRPDKTPERAPSKRAKLLFLERPGEHKGGMILAALRTVLRDEDAQFR